MVILLRSVFQKSITEISNLVGVRRLRKPTTYFDKEKSELILPPVAIRLATISPSAGPCLNP